MKKLYLWWKRAYKGLDHWCLHKASTSHQERLSWSHPNADFNQIESGMFLTKAELEKLITDTWEAARAHTVIVNSHEPKIQGIALYKWKDPDDWRRDRRRRESGSLSA